MQQPQFFSRQVREAKRFYLDLSPSPSRSLAVVCGGREECAPDYVIDRVDFPYLSLEFVSRGRGTLWLDGREFSLAAGSVYSYGPELTHRIVADRADPLVKYFVDFVGDEAGQILDAHGLPLGAVGQVGAPLAIQRSLDDLISHGQRGGDAASQLCDALTRYLLLLIASSASPESAGLSPAYSTYLRCREQIEKHYSRFQSLDEIAKQTFVDKTYVCRLFQRFDHQTPYQYLTRLKMNQAAELLEDSAMLVKQIAAALGYADAFHFSRIFKSVFGMSPKEFRRLRSQGAARTRNAG